MGSIGAGLLADTAVPSAPQALPGDTSSVARRESIKIEQVETFKVVVPLKPGTVYSPDATDLEPFWLDFQKGNPEAPNVIIKQHADNGLFGIGETSRGIPAASVIRNGQFLIGRNILDLNFFDNSLGLADPGGSLGIEIAIYAVETSRVSGRVAGG